MLRRARAGSGAEADGDGSSGRDDGAAARTRTPASSLVAEGVERPDQQRFLRCVGVDAAQGYLHLRPTTAEDLARWLERRSADRAVDVHPAGSVTPIGSRRTG